MCELDYFEEDRKEYEARGLITRRQFGVLVAAGVSLVLPERWRASSTRPMPASRRLIIAAKISSEPPATMGPAPCAAWARPASVGPSQGACGAA